MNRHVLIVASVCLLAAPVAASPSTTPAAGKETRLGLVHVDPVKRELTFNAEVCLREGVLEFLLCAWNTKTHESILHTKAKASHIHAGLLLLGLHPGKPARWSGSDPEARFLPPAGPALTISLSWKDKDGKPRSADSMSWLHAGDKKDLKLPKDWAFVGSEVLPDNRYWADVDGEIISVTNFPSAVIDIPVESSNADAQRDLFADAKAVPEKGTAVTVAIRPRPGAEKCPHARSTLEIDATGSLRIDGEPIADNKLPDWAERFIAAHERGMVVIRAAGGALVHDLETARAQLRLGGVREFDFQRLAIPDGPLPRTAGHLKQAMDEWTRKFAKPDDYIENPHDEAQRQLDRIDRHLKAMDQDRQRLKDYAEQLRAAKLKATPPKGPGT
jgi:hypothetical protein